MTNLDVEQKKNLAILFCSLRPSQYPDLVCSGREEEYYMCIAHMLEVIPLDRFDVVVVDNTVGTLEGVTNVGLKKLLLDDERITDVFFLQENIGERNKGLGELHMLASVLDSIPENTYRNVSYVTARRIVTNPYVFEKTDSMTKGALVSNPNLRYLTGKTTETEKVGLFNDMFFSMTEKNMRAYASFSQENIHFNSTHGVGSEQNLFRFISVNNIEFEEIKWLGLIRNDWMLDFKQTNIDNIHVC